MEAIISGKLAKGHYRNYDETPRVSEVERYFSELLERPRYDDSEPIEDYKVTAPNINKCSAFEDGWTPSAPGPDGITVQQVKPCYNSKLCLLYNVVYYRLCIPTQWKSSRTVLIFKDGDRAEPRNYRPITISSALLRLIHRALALKLKSAINIAASQRGFTDVDGTVANTMIVQYYIRSRAEHRKPYIILALDLQKAFDTVEQSSVLRAMSRLR